MPKNDIGKLIENLKDSGFDEKEIKEFMELYKNCSLDSQCKCLQIKRKKLLDKVHKNEKYIDCLDYLKYSLEKDRREDNKDE